MENIKQKILSPAESGHLFHIEVNLNNKYLYCNHLQQEIASRQMKSHLIFKSAIDCYISHLYRHFINKIKSKTLFIAQIPILEED